jgi:hypothetical protein
MFYKQLKFKATSISVGHFLALKFTFPFLVNTLKASFAGRKGAKTLMPGENYQQLNQVLEKKLRTIQM